MNNLMQIISLLPQFAQEMRGKDVNQMLEDAVSNGQFSQEQVEQARNIYRQNSRMFDQFKKIIMK